jgi:putative thiamine transport system permease protein
MGRAIHQMTRPQTDRWLARLVLAAVLTLILLPIVAGFWQTARAAFGVLPAVGASDIGLSAWHRLATLPGLPRAVLLSLWTGGATALLSLLLAAGCCFWLHSGNRKGLVLRILTPVLAAPHAALAIGLAFLIAPSGWIARAIAPVAGWMQPPDILSLNDPLGLALIAGMTAKEFPFLLLMMLAALNQIPLARSLRTGRMLGVPDARIWLVLIGPQIWPLIRLPLLVVLAYSLSVVDVAMILGPANPPTLAVMLTRLYGNADLALLLPASAGSVLQLGLVVASGLMILLVQYLLRARGPAWIASGACLPGLGLILRVAAIAGAMLLVLTGAALAVLLIWSVTWRWQFPDLLPETLSLRFWMRAGPTIGGPLLTTVMLALSSTAAALITAIGWLEAEDRRASPRAPWAEALIYLPLLLPQIAFLYGLNIAALSTGLPQGIGMVAWGHAIFVFPYVMIALSDPWRALDPRLMRAAAALGAGPWRVLWSVKLPVLLVPILTAAAIGVAVSVAQYLPTLFLGAGRISTLTTEAVTLSSGSDRRVTGVVTSLQALLPILTYGLAFAIPAIVFRNRRALGART